MISVGMQGLEGVSGSEQLVTLSRCKSLWNVHEKTYHEVLKTPLWKGEGGGWFRVLFVRVIVIFVLGTSPLGLGFRV